MGKLRHTIHHGLGLEDARTLAAEAWEQYRVRFSRYDPEIEWQGSDRAVIRFSSRLGGRLACSVELGERKAILEMDIPLLARPFKEIGIAIVEKELSARVAAFKPRRSSG